jgi:hypothetical protein
MEIQGAELEDLDTVPDPQEFKNRRRPKRVAVKNRVQEKTKRASSLREIREMTRL